MELTDSGSDGIEIFREFDLLNFHEKIWSPHSVSMHLLLDASPLDQYRVGSDAPAKQQRTGYFTYSRMDQFLDHGAINVSL